MERTAGAVLRWSGWRRCHQGWARYHHYRRRAGKAGAQSLPQQEVQATEVTDVVWRRLAGVLPPAKRTGRPYTYDRRVVLDAIVYVMQVGCAWRDLPPEFPPWQTVYAQLCRWKESRIWEKIWNGLPEPAPMS